MRSGRYLAFAVAVTSIVTILSFFSGAHAVTVPEKFFVVGEAASIGFVQNGTDASWSDFSFLGVGGNLYYRYRTLQCSTGGCGIVTDTDYVIVDHSALKKFSLQGVHFVADGYDYTCSSFSGRITQAEFKGWSVNDNCTLTLPTDATLTGQGYHLKGDEVQ